VPLRIEEHSSPFFDAKKIKRTINRKEKKMMIDQIRNLAHEMRLFGIHAEAERRAKEGAYNLAFLASLLQDEKEHRRERTAKSLVTRARFRSSATLADWDHSLDRGMSRATLKELARGDFFHRKENLLIVGPTGCGKTHLAIALGKSLCEQAIRTKFFSVNLLFEEVRAEKSAGTYLKWLKTLSQTPVLILDDFGLRNYSHDEAVSLMDLLEERYRKGIVIVTSQVAPASWQKNIEDPVIGEAISDRLRNPAVELILRGESYRERFGKKTDPVTLDKNGDSM
jgi:DNA replication protein DnaC